MDNISLVFGGVDPATQEVRRLGSRHQGADRRGQRRQEDVRQGQEGSARSTQQALKEPAPAVQNKGNIDLVVANYDKLAPIMNEEQQ